jgi:hypothetical protein
MPQTSGRLVRHLEKASGRGDATGCPCRWHASAVGFAAVFYGEDQDGVSEIVKADAVVAGAEAELWRLDVLESFDIAFAGAR